MAFSTNIIIFFFFFFFLTITLARHSAPVHGQCLEDQKKLLLDLKSELIFNPSESYNLVMWNETDDDCCQWEGVECDGGGHVISLDLSNEGISGGMGESSSLFRFPYLSELDLSGNGFTTTYIPNQFHRLPNLTVLDLSNAGLVGPIPSTLSNLTELQKLDLSSNFLTASIPSFHMCSKLEDIDLSDNNLVGSLSHLHLQALTNLYFLDLSGNSLNGTIPHHLLTLPSILILDLYNNRFNGQIKEFPIVNVSNLVYLDLSSNRIEGPIPNSFFQLQNLSSLWLSYNMFNGTFKLQKIQGLPWLEKLDLSYNDLSVETTINSSLHGFPRLSFLRLSSCNLYHFPSLGNLSSLLDLDLSNNHIAGDIPNWI